MANFSYDITDGDTSFEGLNSSDTLTISGIPSSDTLSFLKDDDDLIIYTDAGTSIRLVNHYLNTTSQIETIHVTGSLSIDLTSPNIIVSDGTSTTLTGDAQDNIILGDTADNTIYGEDGNDTIYGGSGNDIIRTGDGDDTVYGGVGNDTIYGGNGINYIDGGSGTDTLSYAEGGKYVTVRLHNGNTTILNQQNEFVTEYYDNIENVVGTASSDTFLLSTSGHTVYGGNLNDAFKTNHITSGHQILYGENGNDIFHLGTGVTHDIDGGAGDNKIILNTHNNNLGTSTIDMINGTIDQNTDGTIEDTFTAIRNITGSKFNDIIIGDTQNNNLKGHNGDDSIDGGAGNDNIHGDEGNDSLNGGADRDILYGDEGNDSLNGGADSDVLYGGDGNDLLYGSEGGDVLYGGDGNDVFIFESLDDYANDTYNEIADFDETEDVIDISEILDGAIINFLIPLLNYINVVDNGTDTIIEVNDNGLGFAYSETVLIQGYTGHGDNVTDMINEGYLVV